MSTPDIDFARDVREGLTAVPKRLPCVYFYDAAGSAIFEEICALPEYYLTRAEREVLAQRAPEIAARSSAGVLVELGSGSSSKTRLLIDAVLAARGTLRYIPVDVSASALAGAVRELARDYPALEIEPLAGEYRAGLRRLAALDGGGSKLVLWLGSNIGNLDRRRAAAFLREVRAAMSPADRFLVGIDLRKDRETLERAYDDAQGVTARFNRNLLARINRELGGRFDLESFAHRAVWNDQAGRIEMHLVSTVTQRVAIEGLGIAVDFEAGESIHTEDSYKWSLEEIDGLAAASGFAIDGRWLDGGGRFSVNLLAPR